MKKLICTILVLVSVCSVSYADISSLMTTYNFYADLYGVTQLDESMIISKKDDSVMYRYENTTVMFAAVNSSLFNSVVFNSEDSKDFLPCCICAAMSLNPSLEKITQSYGQLLYAYLEAKSGKESTIGFFGGLVFYVKIEGDNLRFMVGNV